MKLQPASRKEIKRIALGTLALDVVLIAALFILSLVGVGTFEPLPILLAALGGSILAVLSFTIMCITVQQAVEMEDKKKMQAKFQLSYNIRMIVQAGWVVICFFVPQLHIFAGAIPLAFPKATILILQATGKLLPPDPPRTPKAEESEITAPTEEA